MSLHQPGFITSIFENHYKYYTSVGVETIKQQAGQIEQVSADYQGRVIYELLQNAFDKAEQSVLISVKDNHLFIANDGVKFTYQSKYNYHEGSSKRSDFQSLCSISTSTKNANESIGNKGVGFKSVFSIAENGFVTIHSIGKFLEEGIEAPVSFRVYDSFKTLDVPESLQDEVKVKLKSQIEEVHKERNDRGVPGYYYPIYLNEQDDYVRQLVNKGFVTIIQIPVGEKYMGQVKELFEDIKKFHFQFVQLKNGKDINIDFEFQDNPHLSFIRSTKSGDIKTTLISCALSGEVNELANMAGINIANPQVAILIRDPNHKDEDPKSYLYNYLPTQIESPFKFVDFHADFHTTVDRKSISFDGEIGKYNRALLRGCIELFFSCLHHHSEAGESVKLNYRYIDNNFNDKYPIRAFSWKLIEVLKNSYDVYSIVRSILRVDLEYETTSRLFSALAFNFFNNKNEDEQEYGYFYEYTGLFINCFARWYNDPKNWPDAFQTKFAEVLIETDAPIIPPEKHLPLSLKNELFFKELRNEESGIFIPGFLDLKITSFEGWHPSFRKKLGIKEFSDRNEILKYFRQASNQGKFHNKENQFTEDQQRELLKSITTLMGKTSDSIQSTHRYEDYLNRKNSENTAANFANFSLSTIFLKTKKGKYKPAQLCSYRELDTFFLPDFPEGVQEQTFLKYLGVSFHDHFNFVDLSIYDSLKDGLDYIPALWKRETSDDNLVHKEVVEGVRVIKNGEQILEPALINDNNYRFLYNVSIYDLKDDAKPLLLKEYQNFPKEYLTVLLKKCKESLAHKEDLLRLYQLVFEPFHRHFKEYLVIQNESLFFSNDNSFYLVNSFAEFQLVENLNLDKPVLCYYRSKIENSNYGFVGEVLEFKEETLQVFQKEEKPELKKKLQERMFYILACISESHLSEVNFFENRYRIEELSKKISSLLIYEVDSIQRTIRLNSNETTIVNREYDDDNYSVYFLKSSSTNLIAEAISKAVFNNLRISQHLELILFYKKIEDLKSQYLIQEKKYYQIFCKEWIPDYYEKFIGFTKRILNYFEWKEIDNEWFRYNEDHQSQFLVFLGSHNKINLLEHYIEKEKLYYKGDIFKNFGLEIDYDLHNKEIARLAVKLGGIKSEQAEELHKKVLALKGRLGIKAELESIETEIEQIFKDELSNCNNEFEIAKLQHEIKIENDINRIFNKRASDNSSVKTNFSIDSQFDGEAVLAAIAVSAKKVIYQGKEISSTNSEVIGANGEEEVLLFLIQNFIENQVGEARVKSLNEVYKQIIVLIGLESEIIQKYFNHCIDVVNDNEKLTKALIPYFYITLHYKYAFVDIVAWYNNKPYLIEVKSTTRNRHNYFNISKSEVDAARKYDNYMIVRVTPEKMIFLGNPIKNIEDKFTEIKGSNFRIQPKGYSFEFV
ncbi:MAG: sacsin N-terminal ATP-binding-like domain-containing protein [Cytophagaceae bacterium]